MSKDSFDSPLNKNLGDYDEIERLMGKLLGTMYALRLIKTSTINQAYGLLLKVHADIESAVYG